MSLSGKNLIFAVNQCPPYVKIDYNNANDKWDFHGGYEVEMLKLLSYHLNFTYRIINCNKNWGTQLPNKSWTGIVGKVSSKFSDVGSCGLSVTYDRAKAVEFLNPYTITTLSFITSVPKGEKDITLIIEPFSYLVWICFIISLIIMIFQGKILSKYYVELKNSNINCGVVCVLLRQSIPYRFPSILPLRIILCCWLLVCLVLTSAYSGCLHGMMAFPLKLKTTDTIEELAIAQKIGKIQVFTTTKTAYYQMFKTAKFGAAQQIGAFIKPNPYKGTGLDFVKNSTESPKAFIYSRMLLTYEMFRLGPESVYLPPSNEESSFSLEIKAIAVQKGFKYKKQFNKVISNIVKGGFIDYWYLRECRKVQSVKGFDKKDNPREEIIALNKIGKLFRIATAQNPPHTLTEYEAKNDTWILTGGYEVVLFMVLSKYLNFTHRIINCNNDWGTQLPNKTWTGIIGKIESKFSDIGFSGLSVTNDRSKVVDFLNPHFISTVSFITSMPKMKNDITLILQAFDYCVWICFIFSLLIMLFYQNILSKYYVELKTIDINWVIICTSLRQQFSCHLPSVGPLRILLCGWVLSCLVLTSSYSGCLHALMAFPSREKTINSIEELSIAQKNGEIQVLATRSSSHYHALKTAKFGLHREIGSLIKPVPNKGTGVDTVKNSEKAHAFISTRDFFTYEILRLGPKSIFLPQSVEESALNLDIRAIAVQKGFKFKKQFNIIISDLIKGGLIDYWRDCENRKVLKNNKEDQKCEIIHLRKLYSILNVFFIAIIFSTFVFLIELAHSLYSR